MSTSPGTPPWSEATQGVEALSSARGDTDLPLRPEQVEAYLLVLEGASSTVVNLPAAGELVIGRGDAAAVRLRDPSVSRNHAQLSVIGGLVELTDLGSQNGTKVNGEPVIGRRRLSSGDVITILTTTLVFHSSNRARTARQNLGIEAFRARVEEEFERVARSRRTFSVAAVALAEPSGAAPRRVVDPVAVVRAADSKLRRLDVAAVHGNELLVLLPETDARDAREIVERVVRALRLPAPQARAGVAAAPTDGNDVDVLIGGARAAAERAGAAEVALASDTYRLVEVDGRQLLVADPAMIRLVGLLERLARSDLPVLVCGETGSGKEMAATVLHQWSSRAPGPLVVLNCAALPETLAESELFGHERGAFTGAVAQKLGSLEAARGGTVFLDEIGELSLAIQAKLLRALETKRITRVGATTETAVDMRIVAATNRDLAEEVKAGRFRQDLLFRLGGATVWLPPLRARRREIPLLAARFLTEACARVGREALTIAPDAMQVLQDYGWPGNVRELRNVMDYTAAAVDEPTLAAWHLVDRLGGEGRAGPGRASGPIAVPAPATDAPSAPSAPHAATLDGDAPLPASFVSLDDEIRELEKLRMGQALAVAGGNQTAAAELLKMPLRTFQAKAKAYGLRRKDKDRD